MFSAFGNSPLDIVSYIFIEGMTIFLFVQASDRYTEWRQNRMKKKFEDILCEACNKGGKKLYRCTDKTTWLCWKCKPVFNAEWREKQKELTGGAKEGE